MEQDTTTPAEVGNVYRLHAPGEPVDGQTFTVTRLEVMQYGNIHIYTTRNDGQKDTKTPDELARSLACGRLVRVR